MADYASMPLQAQVDLMRKEATLTDALNAKAQMWRTAFTEINEAGISMGKATDAVEPKWTDRAGDLFVRNTRNAKQVVDTWARNIETNKPDKALGDVAKGIVDTLRIVEENFRKAQEALANTPPTPGQDFAGIQRAIEKPYQEANGQAMTALDGTWDAAANAVRGAGSGSDWQQQAPAPGSAPGASPEQSPSGAQSPAGADPSTATQANQAAPGQAANPAQAGAGPSQGGASPAGSAGGGGSAPDPSLAGGLGAAPTIPPPTLPPATPLGPPVVPGGGGPMMPMIPPAFPGAGIRGGGGGGGGGFGGGGRIPGVSIGGSAASGSIPAAGPTVSTPPVPTAGTAPAAQGGPTAAQSTTGAGGGIPPMMPPMGGAAAGGGRGGGPGSGAAQRPGRNRRRDEPTPGLPAVLSGKAGKADLHAFTARTRATAPESDVPTTVQLIDEDLWQVAEPAPAPVVAAEAFPTGHRAR